MTSPRNRLPPGVGGGASASGAAAAVLVGIGLGLGPPTILAMVATVILIASQDDFHWQEIAGCAGVVAIATVTVLLASGVNPLAFHYQPMLSWLAGLNLGVDDLSSAFGPACVLGLPIGVGLGACIFGTAEARAVDADWHPLDRRWQRIEARRVQARVAAAAADGDAQERCSAPPLGVARDGDLDTWREHDFVVMPPRLRGLGVAIVGASGSGKTETTKQIARWVGASDRTLIFADCKGTDPTLAEAVLASYRSASPRQDMTAHLFPAEPFNGWLGPPNAVVSRLMLTQDFTEPHYENATRAVLNSVVGDGCGSSVEFLNRLSLASLKASVKAGHLSEASYDALRNSRAIVDGARLRYEPFLHSLNGAFDGERSYGDSDVVVLSVPTLISRDDAEATMRMQLLDLMQWASDPARKPRVGHDFVVVIDELPAIIELVPFVIDLCERVRDVGGQVVVTAQSPEGLGVDESEQNRLIGAMAGGVILHRCVAPDRLCELAGTVRVPEQSWQLEDTGHSGLGSMRQGFRMKVRPDDVRQSAEVGEAWAISSGQYLHMNVLAVDVAPWLADARELARRSEARGDEIRARTHSGVVVGKASGDSGAGEKTGGEAPW